MPIKYHYDGNLVLLELTGEYTQEELKASFLQEITKPTYPKDAMFLIDVTGSRSFEMRTHEQVRKMGVFLAKHKGTYIRKCAALVSSDVQYGLSRMGAAYSQMAGLDIKVFIEAGDAMKWLEAED